MAEQRARLILLCGSPASGKTTLARRLAPVVPAVRLDKDDWVEALGHDLWDDAFRVRIEAQLWALTLDLLAQHQSVILEWGHWARVERDEKRLAARALGVEVLLTSTAQLAPRGPSGVRRPRARGARRRARRRGARRPSRRS